MPLLNEQSLGRVYQHTQNRNIGIITAHRGEFDSYTNTERNANLAAEIKRAGLGYIHVKGRYIENYGTDKARPVDERSLLVIGKDGDDSGKLKGTLLALGKKYGQDSVVIKPHDSLEAHLHGTKEGTYPGEGNSVKLGPYHPNRAGEFHTILRNTKTFNFSEQYVCESIVFASPRSFFSREETEF